MPVADGVLFCGGGTGGHVLPGLAVAAAMRGRGRVGLRWIGDPARIEAKLVPAAGIPLLPHGLSRPRPGSPRWLVSALRVVGACWHEITARPPRAVVALGGYAALVPGLLAPLTRRPLVVLEQNARAGRTNRLLARFADAVVTQFPEAAAALPRRRVHQLGNPVRAIPPAARGGSPRLTLLVAGGSLAAKSLNDLVLGAAALLKHRSDLHVIHLAGVEDQARVEAAYRTAGWFSGLPEVRTSGLPDTASVEVHGFVTDMPGLYARTDLALTRAGATTVAELCAAGIGALYIPLPWAAEDHQTANARAVARVGGAVVLPQSTTTAVGVVRVLLRLLEDRAAVGQLGRGALRLARPDAADQVADLVEQVESTRRRIPAAQAKRQARLAFQRSLAGRQS